MTDAITLIRQVENARRALIASVDGLSDNQATYKPDSATWSAVENVEHLYLAEMSGLAKIWAALDAARAGKRWTDPNPNRGKSIEAVIEATWKSREVAPPIATPHIGGPLAFWIATTRTLTALLADLGVGLSRVSLDDVVFPHFLSGPLDGRQRLEFSRFHIERHIQQIERLKGDAAFPA